MAVTPIGVALEAIQRTIGPIGQIAFGAVALFAVAVFLGYDPVAIATNAAESWIRGLVGL